MPYDLGVIKRQRREPPTLSTSTYGGNFVGFYSTGSNYYAVHVFTSSGQFTKPSYVTTTTAQVLVVAGGGPGGTATAGGVGGGGGAGGVVNSSTYSIVSTLTIYIGAGGTVGVNGSDSTITNGVTVLTAIGGGLGGAPTNGSGAEGGSGGGGSGTGTGGTSTSTQGNVGGAGGSQTLYAGGGGGASTVGGGANASASGQGGSGTITLITGSPIWLAGGGGGGANATGYNNGSYGGGGAGGNTSAVAGTAGTLNSGAGGGGGGGTTGAGGAGSSGIVIISYAIPANLYPSIQSDPYFTNNALLLNGTTSTFGGNAALITYSFFTDLSDNRLPTTTIGSTATSVTPFDPGSYHSLYFNGGNYLIIGTNNNYNFIHSTTAIVTIEFWVYPTSLTSNPFIFSTNAGSAAYFGGSVQITSSGNIAFTISGGSASYVVQATSLGTITTNNWSHVAVTWNYVGNTGAFYINGNQSGTFIRGSGAGAASNSLLGVIVGQSGSNSNFYNGYVSNLRLVNGTVVYTGSFTPSLEPLSTVQFAPSSTIATITSGTTALIGRFLTTATTIADYSTLTNVLSNIGSVNASTLNPFTTLVNESAYFNGSSQYVTIPVTGSLFELNGSSFTMECWVYITTAATNTLWTLGVNGVFAHTQAGVDGNGSVYFQTAFWISSTYWYGGWNGMKAATPNNVVNINTWAHIAFVRDGGTFKIFVNGTQQDSRTFVEPNAGAYGTVFIGSYYSISGYFKGYISNFRLARGLAVYSGNFTVPTGPLQVTQVANPYGGSNTQAISTASYTSLLTFRYGTYGVNPIGFIDYGTNNYPIVPVGQPSQGTFSPFGNNWSTFFNGLTDYLSIPVIYSSSATLTALNFGSNSWTIETWAYLTANTGTAYIAGQFNTNNNAPLGLSISANKPSVTLSNSGASTLPTLTITSPTALSTGTWNHIAAVRDDTKISMYVNGVEQAYSFSSSPISDLSINTATITNNNATFSTLNPYDQGPYHSLYFDGLSCLNLSANAGYNFGTGDFTMECWVYPIAYVVGAATASEIIDLWTNASGSYIVGQCQLQINSAGTVSFNYATTVSVFATISSTALIPLNAWTHIVVVRNGTAVGNVKIYINGVNNGTSAGAVVQVLGSTGAGSIGRQTNITSTPYFFNGYISNVRIVKGLALYSGSFFDPPQNILSNTQSATPGGALANLTTNTTQLLVGRFINQQYFFDDYSSNNFTLTNTGDVTAANLYPPITSTSTFNSMYFNGSTQYLNVSGTNSQFAFGTGDFTVEMWVYQIARSANFATLYDSRPAGTPSGASHLGFGISPAGIIFGSTIISLNTWYHVAYVRAGTVGTGYINGVAAASVTDTTNLLNGTNRPIIGTDGNVPLSAGYIFNGYITNIRVVKGTALYTSNFTPPAVQLSNVSGTSLLIAKSSSIISEGVSGVVVDYSVVPNSITRVGSPTVSNLYPPITSTSTYYNSLYFNGTSQYLTVPNSTAITLDTGDFTIEAWVYATVLNGQNGIFGKRELLQYIGVIFRVLNTTNKLVMQIADSSGRSWAIDSNLDFGLPALTTNTWYHVALVRSGSSFTIYQNGVGGTAYTYSGTISHNTAPGYIGKSDGASGNQFWNGYISNLRIVKGVGVYTGNFTRPTQPLTVTQSANPYGGSNVQAISTGTYTSLLTILPTSTSNIVDYSTNTSAITIGTGSVSLSTLNPFVNSVYNSIYFSGNSSMAPSPVLTYAAGSLLFNGTTQYLSATKSGGWLSSDHTVEAWIYLNAYTSPAACIAGESNGSTLDAWEWYVTSSVIAIAYRLSGTLTTISASTTFSLSTWYHVAFSRSGTTVRLFVNGVQVTSGTITGWTPQNILSIGYLESSFPYRFNGYITNFRMVNGTTVYTSNFTPLLPLSNITNTTILLLVNSDANKIVDSSSTPVTFTNNGAATFSSTVIPSTPNPWLNYGDHTVEAWVYLNSSTVTTNNITANMLIAGTYDGATTAGWEWTINPYFMTLNYRSSGVLTSFGTGQLPILSQVIADRGGNGLSPTNIAVTLSPASPLSDGYGSLYFNGTNAQITNPNNSGFNFGSGSFTIESWVYYLGQPNFITIIGHQNGPSPGRAWLLTISPAGTISFDWSSTGTAGVPGNLNSTSAAPLNQWNHIAFVRNGTTYTFYINGQAAGSGSMTASVAFSGSLAIGYTANETTSGQSFFKGYISNLRVVKGIAVYTGNFTPTGRLTSTQVAGTNIQAILTASYTSILLAANPAVSSQTFATNTWNHVAFTRLSTTATMYINGVATSSTQITSYTEQNNLRLGYIGFNTATSSYLTGYISNFRIVSGVAVYTGTNFVPPTGLLTTQHPRNPYAGTNTNAITFNTSTRILTASFNGVSVVIYNSATNMLVGRAGSAVTSMFPGYLSNLRIVNGTAVYKSSFVPPRAPLSLIKNTSLLIAASRYHVDKSTNNFIVTTGTVASLPNITKFTPYKTPGEYNKSVIGGSVYFNTTTAASQNLRLGSIGALALGSGNYTVECWIYVQGYNANNSALIDWRTNAGTTAGVPVMYLLANGTIQWQNTGGTGFLTSPTRLTLNTWNHVAMVRYNSILHMYIDGAVVASAADSTVLTIQTLFINSPVTASNQTLFGFISNVRILVGRAIYTPTITVPTTTLTTVTNTTLLALQNDSVLKDNSSNNFVLTKPNTSTIFQQVLSPFRGVGSAYFNGVNNYLTISTGTNQAFNFDVNDFTLEAWVYPTARNGIYGSLIIGPVNYPTTIDWIWMINPNGYLYVQLGAATAGSGVIISTSQVPLSQWSHVACVRLYGVMTLYINGQAVGTNVSGSVTQYAGGSLYFAGGGNNQRLSLPASSAFDLSGGTWTIEFWMYSTATPTAGNACRMFMFGVNGSLAGFSLAYTSEGVVYVGIPFAPGPIGLSSAVGAITLNTWYHVAFVSNAGSAKVYINGTLSGGPVTITQPTSSSPTLFIGYDTPGTVNFQYQGYLTNIRIVNGSAVYTSNFAPTLPLANITNTKLLLLVNNGSALIDSSSSPITVTNSVSPVTYNASVVPSVTIAGGGATFTSSAAGSIYFNGSDAQLSIPNNGSNVIGTSEFTIETWVYIDPTAINTNTIMERRTYNGVGTGSWHFFIGNGGSLVLYQYQTVGYIIQSGDGVILKGQWYHVAVSRDSLNVIRLFVNGVLNNSVTDAYNFSNTNPIYIGYNSDAAGVRLKGYLSNLRFIIGTAVYINNFSPIVPLTNSYPSITQLLLLNSSGAPTADSSGNSAAITNANVTYNGSVVPSVTIISGGIATATNTINVGIGAAINGNAATTFNGYITNLNVIKGAGKYTGSFTPPTSDVSTVTNTSLLTLLSTNTTFIDSSPNTFVITNTTTATTFQQFSPYSTSSWGAYFDGSSYMYVNNAQPLVLSTSTNWTIEAWINPTGNYGVSNVLFAKRNAGITFKSMSFNGTSQFLSISTNTGAFLFGADDFTIECWFYTNSAATQQAIVSRGPSDNDDELLILLNAGQYYVDWGGNATGEQWQSVSGAYAANQWTHLAVVRYLNVLYVYSNGVSVASSGGTTIISRALTNNYPFRIGQGRTNTFYFNGNISNFRVVKGLAVYTGNFNPPNGLLSTTQVENPFSGINTQAITTSTSTALLTGQFNTLNSIVDLSINNSLITNNNTVATSLSGPTFYNSVQFNGTNQYLIAPVGASSWGTGDFTVECWFYKTAATTCTLLDNATGGADVNYWTLATYADGHCQFQIRDSSSQSFVIGSIITAINTWVHLAVTRTSGLVKLFVNGVLDNSGTITKTVTARTTNIGSFQFTGFVDYFTGYISNVRLLTGIALYTTSTSFTVPTQPLSKYLPVSSGIGSAAGSSGFSFVSNSAVDFTNPNFATGTGDFTAECWVYMDPSSDVNAGFMTSVSSAVPGWNIARDFVGLTPANGSGSGDTFAWTISSGVWNHVALTLRSGQVQAWLNGASVGTLTRTYVTPAGTTISLGRRYTSTLIYPFVGYISNARFVAGVGVYTGAFTAPTTQLQTTQPSGTNIQAISTASYVQLLTAQTNSIADFSTTATTVTVVGSVVANNSYVPTLLAPLYSLSMNGGSYLTIGAASNWTFMSNGLQDYTMECWFITNSTAYTSLMGTAGNTYLIGFELSINFTGAGSILLGFNNGIGGIGNNSLTVTNNGIFSTGVWNHVAVTFAEASNEVRIFVNGQAQTTSTYSGSYTAGSYSYSGSSPTGALNIGYGGAGTSVFTGWISNVRVTKFIVYTGNFTTPLGMLRSSQVGSGSIQSISTASLVSLLIGQSNIVTDNSKNNYIITNSGPVTVSAISPFPTSVAYDASYTTLLTANFIGTATNIKDNGNNLYTITSNNSPPVSILSPFGLVYATTSTSYQGYLSSSTGYIGFYNGTQYSTSTTALTTGTWNHVAYTYDNKAYPLGNVNIYVNGFRVLQTTATIRGDAGENLYIGGVYGVTENFYGYMSNFRLVKDSSLYLGSYFGVPTSKLNTTTNTLPYPLTSTISTSLLTLQDNHIVDNSTNAYSLTASGTPKIITFSPFAANPNISAYFNGTTDFINVSAQTALSFGTGDFNIEVWVYPTAVPTSYSPVLDARADTSNVPWMVGMYNSGGVLKAFFFDSATLRLATTTITLNSWTHLAWSRTNSILRIFVNGVVDYVLFNYTTNILAQGTTQLIGKMREGTGYIFQGFMTNLRVVKGTSLYTGNFNPSQITLTQASGGTTNLLTTFVDGRAIDYSSNNVIRSTTSTVNLTNSTTKYNVYSMNFNGSTDALTVSSSTNFVYNANDFTWEMWVYPTSPIWATTSTYFIEHGPNGGSLRYSNNKVSYYNVTTATSTASFTLSINSSTWTHLAVSRYNNVTSVFVNGALSASAADTYSYNTSTIVTIGNTSTNASNYFQGYIEDLRITKGLARYTSTFVSPIKLSNR